MYHNECELICTGQNLFTYLLVLKILVEPWFKPRAAGWDAQTLPRCYAALPPLQTLIRLQITKLFLDYLATIYRRPMNTWPSKHWQKDHTSRATQCQFLTYLDLLIILSRFCFFNDKVDCRRCWYQPRGLQIWALLLMFAFKECQS